MQRKMQNVERRVRHDLTEELFVRGYQPGIYGAGDGVRRTDQCERRRRGIEKPRPFDAEAVQQVVRNPCERCYEQCVEEQVERRGERVGAENRGGAEPQHQTRRDQCENDGRGDHAEALEVRTPTAQIEEGARAEEKGHRQHRPDGGPRPRSPARARLGELGRRNPRFNQGGPAAGRLNKKGVRIEDRCRYAVRTHRDGRD